VDKGQKKERLTPVHARAAELGLEVRTPVSLKAERDAFAALNADVAVVVAYGLILPQYILDAPRLGCLNIHASLLPRWRGAAPIHRAVMAGDAETGVCIMQMEAGLDTGPVFLREITEIGQEDTTGDLHERLSAMGARLIVETLARHAELASEPQPEEGVTYAEKIDKAEARVDWTDPADAVDRKIRGLAPFPGAWSEVGGHRVKFLASRVAQGNGTPGQVLDEALSVACGTGAVELLRLQRAGKGPQDKADFIRGLPLPPGTQFGEE